jgi:hypothetical protein
MGGSLLLWVGWYGFNAGSTLGMSTAQHQRDAANAAMTTTLSAVSASVTVGLVHLIRSRGHTIDILGVANGLLAGLVSITAGCDSIDPVYSLIVGLVGGLAYMGAVWVRTRLKIDDVVDAFAVHGASGLWGCLAVGLFHRDTGFFVTGDGAQLGSQTLGVIVCIALGALPTAGLCRAMRWHGSLRVSTSQEEAGLDSEFGLHAYVRRSEALERCETVAALLRSHGHTPRQLLEALSGLRTIISRPFTPQAADFKLEGEIKDIMQHLVTDLDLPTNPMVTGQGDGVTVPAAHLAFLSHHKSDAGDAARIFADTSRRLLVSAESARSLAQNGKYATLLSRIRVEDLLFLDSMMLKDLPKLLDSVEASANYVLLLSRHVLRRPWVLAELCRAHECGRNKSVVLIEYPGRGDDPKAFRFPHDLDAVVSEWTVYVEQQERASSPRNNKGSGKSMRNLVRSPVRSGDGKTGTLRDTDLSPTAVGTAADPLSC